PVEVNPSPPKNITLVPVTGSEATAPVIEAPITSVPASSTAQEANDTTALPSEQYAAAAARVRAQRQAQQQQPKVTDPRALTGAPYQEAPAPSAPAPPPSAQPVRTTAFPEYKPLPRMTFDRQMTARLTVTVDPDGRVTDIEVNQPVPQMPKIIAAVQNWRFRPATENGMPVTARVAVDIIFHGNGEGGLRRLRSRHRCRGARLSLLRCRSAQRHQGRRHESDPAGGVSSAQGLGCGRSAGIRAATTGTGDRRRRAARASDPGRRASDHRAT